MRGSWVALAGMALACGDSQPFTSPGPTPRTTPTPLEAVPFDAMGSGKVMFKRIGSISTGGSWSAVYVIDADARQSSRWLASVSAPYYPALSPAGDAVAWSHWTDTQSCFDVYVTDLAGGHSRQMSSDGCNNEGAPSWTPSGSGVVFFVTYSALTAPWGIYDRDL